jgi:hypothetical protein
MDRTTHPIRSALAYGAGLAAGGCAAYAATTWFRFGHACRANGRAQDPWLDRFMPDYDVVDRHRLYVAAPADVTFAAACAVDLEASPIIRLIFQTRAAVLGARTDAALPRRGILQTVQALGWGVLADRPGREMIFGAVTKPWEADVVFRALPPEEFAPFNEPGFVKIAWTLRADPVGDRRSIVRTETRALATGADARSRFRRYWTIFSPGIVLIRRVLLKRVKRDAERQHARLAAPSRDRFELVSRGDLDREC